MQDLDLFLGIIDPVYGVPPVAIKSEYAAARPAWGVPRTPRLMAAMRPARWTGGNCALAFRT